jgi:hypothetical protein
MDLHTNPISWEIFCQQFFKKFIKTNNLNVLPFWNKEITYLPRKGFLDNFIQQILTQKEKTWTNMMFVSSEKEFWFGEIASFPLQIS